MADPITTSHHGIAPPAKDDTPVTFTLDGRSVTAAPGEFLIAAAERVGTFIPRFCYHPRMKPVGMCRMCLVEVSSPRGPSLQPACYVPVAEGMEVVTTSDKVRKAQDGVLEFLLINHPLDCPVCDKGGECPLQDQTMAYGPGESRFLEEKRHWAKPIPISELVLLDRERCIQCGRCVRFAAEVAGEAQIDLLGRGDRVEVNIFEEQQFSSYFSGNTIQICPVGALTSAPYRFTARPWDLDQVESTCTTCAVGCRVAVQSSANRVTRMLGVDVDAVNQSWLCDKGRFGYQAVNSEDRLTEPLVRRSPDGELEPASWGEALTVVADRLRSVRDGRGGDAIGVIGGARGSNEDAFAWARLAKAVLGTDSVDAQLGDGLPAEVVLGVPRATIDDTCSAPCVVLLGGDLREELPVLFLRLRAAAVDGDTTLVELAPRSSALTPFAASLPVRPGEVERVVRALAAGQAPDELGLPADAFAEALGALGRCGGDGADLVVVLGRPSLAEDAGLVAAAAAALSERWPKARFLPALRRGNVMGALDMGLAPGVLPGRVSLSEGRSWFEAAWGPLPAATGRDCTGILQGLADETLQALVLVGADPLGDFPDRSLAQRALQGAGFVVAVDAFLSPSAAQADVVLPVAMHHERAGTTTNIEGRITRLGQKLVPPGQAWPDWMVASELAARLGVDFDVSSAADLWDGIERLAVSHAGITGQVLQSPAGRDGVVAPLPAARVTVGRRGPVPEPIDPMATPGIESVERQGAPPRVGLAGRPGLALAAAGEPGAAGAKPSRLGWPQPATAPHVAPLDSYSLRLVSTRRLYDEGVLLEVSEALAPLAPAATARVNPAELDRLGVASGGQVRVRSAQGSLQLQAVADPGVPRGVLAVGFNLDGADGGAASLIRSGEPVVDVRLESTATAPGGDQ